MFSNFPTKLTVVVISSPFKKCLTDHFNLTCSLKVAVLSRNSAVSPYLKNFNLSCSDHAAATIIDQGIPALVDNYTQRFRSLFPYPSDYEKEREQSLEAFSKAITSNLIAGVGYFYGTSIVNRGFSFEWDEDEDAAQSIAREEEIGEVRLGARLTDPKALLTATPSRSFFPRGFYWYIPGLCYGLLLLKTHYRDEGFHLLHIGHWDTGFRSVWISCSCILIITSCLPAWRS